MVLAVDKILTMKGLPFINSVHKYTVSVEVEPSLHNLYYDPKFSKPQFAITLHVAVKYRSVDESNPNTLDVLSCKTKVLLPSHEVMDYKRQIIKTSILDEVYILDVASSMKQKTSGDPFYNVLPFTSEITKTIELSDIRLELFLTWYSVKSRADTNFLRDYKRAISRPRTMGEELEAEQERLREIQGSEVADKDHATCAICLEEMAIGYTMKLRCSHTFHQDCIWKWAFKSRRCPLCRVSLLRPDPI